MIFSLAEHQHQPRQRGSGEWRYMCGALWLYFSFIFLNAIVTPCTYSCQWVSEWVIVSEWRIAIASPSFANLIFIWALFRRVALESEDTCAALAGLARNSTIYWTIVHLRISTCSKMIFFNLDGGSTCVKSTDGDCGTREGCLVPDIQNSQRASSSPGMDSPGPGVGFWYSKSPKKC